MCSERLAHARWGCIARASGPSCTCVRLPPRTSFFRASRGAAHLHKHAKLRPSAASSLTACPRLSLIHI
eukprot:11293175-Alexandrium_andersonii.AAC.1